MEQDTRNLVEESDSPHEAPTLVGAEDSESPSACVFPETRSIDEAALQVSKRHKYAEVSDSLRNQEAPVSLCKSDILEDVTTKIDEPVETSESTEPLHPPGPRGRNADVLARHNALPGDALITFDEDKHIYHVRGTKVGVSVTTFYKKYMFPEPPFDFNECWRKYHSNWQNNAQSDYYKTIHNAIQCNADPKEAVRRQMFSAGPDGTTFHRFVELDLNRMDGLRPNLRTDPAFFALKAEIEQYWAWAASYGLFPELLAPTVEDCLGSGVQLKRALQGALQEYQFVRLPFRTELSVFYEVTRPTDGKRFCVVAGQLDAVLEILQPKREDDQPVFISTDVGSTVLVMKHAADPLNNVHFRVVGQETKDRTRWMDPRDCGDDASGVLRWPQLRTNLWSDDEGQSCCDGEPGFLSPKMYAYPENEPIKEVTPEYVLFLDGSTFPNPSQRIFEIVDWKRVHPKKSFDSNQRSFGGHVGLGSRLRNMQCNEFYKYSAQQSLYAIMLERMTGISVRSGHAGDSRLRIALLRVHQKLEHGAEYSRCADLTEAAKESMEAAAVSMMMMA